MKNGSRVAVQRRKMPIIDLPKYDIKVFTQGDLFDRCVMFVKKSKSKGFIESVQKRHWFNDHLCKDYSQVTAPMPFNGLFSVYDMLKGAAHA